MALRIKFPVRTVLLMLNILTRASRGMLNIPDMNPFPEPIPSPAASSDLTELANLLQLMPPTLTSPNVIPGGTSSNYPKNIQDAIKVIRSFMSASNHLSADQNSTNPDPVETTVSQVANNVTPGLFDNQNSGEQPGNVPSNTPPSSISVEGNGITSNGNDQLDLQPGLQRTTAANTQNGHTVDVSNSFMVLPNTQSAEMPSMNANSQQTGPLMMNLAMQSTNAQSPQTDNNGMSLASAQNPTNLNYRNMPALSQSTIDNRLSQYPAQQGSMVPMMQNSLQGTMSNPNMFTSQAAIGGTVLNNLLPNSVPTNQRNVPENANLPCPYAQTPPQATGQVNQATNSNAVNGADNQPVQQIPSQLGLGLEPSQSAAVSGNPPAGFIPNSNMSPGQTNFNTRAQTANMYPGAPSMFNRQDPRFGVNNPNPSVNVPSQYISRLPTGQAAAPNGLHSDNSNRNQMTLSNVGNLNAQQLQNNQGFIPTTNNIQNMRFMQAQIAKPDIETAPQGFQQAQSPNPELDIFQPMIGRGSPPSSMGGMPQGTQGLPKYDTVLRQPVVQPPSLNQGQQLPTMGARSQSGTSSGTSQIYRTPQGQLFRMISAPQNQPMPSTSQFMLGNSNRNTVQPSRTSGQSAFNNPLHNTQQPNQLGQRTQFRPNSIQNPFQRQINPQNNPRTQSFRQTAQQLPQNNVQAPVQNTNSYKNGQGLRFVLQQAPTSFGNQNMPSSNFIAQGTRPNTIQQRMPTSNRGTIPGRVNPNTSQIVSAKGIGQDSPQNIRTPNNVNPQNSMTMNPNQRPMFSQIPATQFNGINRSTSSVNNQNQQNQASTQVAYRQTGTGNTNNFGSGGFVNPQATRMMLSNGNRQQTPQLNRPPMFQRTGQFNGRQTVSNTIA